MASGSFNVYNAVKLKLGDGGLDLTSATLCYSLIKTTYTPALSHSDYSAQILSHEVSASQSSKAKILTNVDWTNSSSTAFYLKADNPVVTAGDTMTAKYGLIYAKTLDYPLCYIELDTTTTIESQRITTRFNGSSSAGLIFKVRNG